MNFELESQYLEIQEQARAFAIAIRPFAVEADESSEIHPGVLTAFRESGLGELMVPEQFGGRSENIDPLAWDGGMAVRHGDWKLMKQKKGARLLYNLAGDIGEKTDLANQHPEIVETLQAKWNAWNSEMALER